MLSRFENDAHQIFFDAEEKKIVPHQLTKRCASNFSKCVSFPLFIYPGNFQNNLLLCNFFISKYLKLVFQVFAVIEVNYRISNNTKVETLSV